jgi:hypothetical protein
MLYVRSGCAALSEDATARACIWASVDCRVPMLIGGDEAIVRPNVADDDGRMWFPNYFLDSKGSVSWEHFQ